MPHLDSPMREGTMRKSHDDAVVCPSELLHIGRKVARRSVLIDDCERVVARYIKPLGDALKHPVGPSVCDG